MKIDSHIDKYLVSEGAKNIIVGYLSKLEKMVTDKAFSKFLKKTVLPPLTEAASMLLGFHKEINQNLIREIQTLKQAIRKQTIGSFGEDIIQSKALVDEYRKALRIMGKPENRIIKEHKVFIDMAFKKGFIVAQNWYEREVRPVYENMLKQTVIAEFIEPRDSDLFLSQLDKAYSTKFNLWDN